MGAGPLLAASSRQILAMLCCLGCVVVARQAAAQTPPGGTAGSMSTAPSPSDDIVVTANKREENVNRVGLTITALSAETLSERRITSLDDIAAVVPGLSFAHSGSNTPILTLRGVGYNSPALGSYPAVSAYVDQVPLPFSVLALHAAYDLERIEVLKGPQGTLFGENSTGGAINFIAAKPSRSFQAGGDISYGRFNRVEGNAYVSGPIADGLRMRVAVTGADSDGWQISTSRPTDRNGALRYVAARALLDWEASDRVHLSFSLNGWIDRSEPQAGQFIALYAKVPGFLTPGEVAAPFSRQNPRAADWSTGQFTPRTNRKFWQPALRMDLDLTNAITLTSLTSYDHFTQTQTQDYDGLPLNIDDFHENGYIHSFNQELRVQNSAASRLRWILGANYENSRTFDYQYELFSDNSLNNPFLLNLKAGAQQSRQRIRNYAVFGNAEYDLGPELTARGGVRYTVSHNDATLCAADGGDGSVAALFNAIATPPFTPVGYTGPIESRCASLNARGAPNLSPTTLSLSEHNVAWRVGLDYKPRPGLLVYANVSRGYKAGSFPTSSATLVAQFQPVTQESLMAFETGAKADLFGRLLHVDAAVFYYDYRNKQSLGKVLFLLYGAQPALVNVPKSRVYGLDADVSLRPFRGLTITGSLTYLASRIERYVGYDPFNNLTDFAASKVPFTPKWNYGADVEYRRPLRNNGTGFAGLSVQGASSQATTIGGDRLTIPSAPGTRVLPGLLLPYRTNPYATVDLRIGYEAPNGVWKVMLYGKNILNKYYWNNVIDGEPYIRFAGEPATYGISLGVKFR